jgi:DNA topoisomerase-3
MNYLCEKATGADRTCTFRTGKIILQQEIPPEQIKKLLAEGKTELLTKFISKKNNRAFKAFLAIGKDGKIGFEFPPRESKGRARLAKKPGEPIPKVDFTGREPLGKCPKCGGKIFDTEAGYICEKSQMDAKPCRFKINREILQQPIEPEQARKLLSALKTDLLDKFISKSGKSFRAFLVMDKKGKVTFDFPSRE